MINDVRLIEIALLPLLDNGGAVVEEEEKDFS